MMPYQESGLGLQDLKVKKKKKKNRKSDQLESFCRDVVSPVEKGRK